LRVARRHPRSSLIVSWTFLRVAPMKVDSIFRLLQFVSASLYSLGHGVNDAQKTSGIIAVLLLAWHDGRGLFRAVLGGDLLPDRDGAGNALWRLAYRSYDGFEDHAALAAAGLLRRDGGAITLFMATYLGIPVSTTHTITGAIIGVGAARRVTAALGRGARLSVRLDRDDADGRTNLGDRLCCIGHAPDGELIGYA
jgi:PiT family inorganic phosphate transporter